VKLGKANCDIHVHRKLLRSRSPYFKRILARCCGATTNIKLDDVDSNTFCFFLSWLYANSFSVPKEDDWMDLCKLWLLAERLEVRQRLFDCILSITNISHRFPRCRTRSWSYSAAVCTDERLPDWTWKYSIMFTTILGQDQGSECSSHTYALGMGTKMSLHGC